MRLYLTSWFLVFNVDTDIITCACRLAIMLVVQVKKYHMVQILQINWGQRLWVWCIAQEEKPSYMCNCCPGHFLILNRRKKEKKCPEKLKSQEQIHRAATALKEIKSQKSTCASAQRQPNISNVVQALSEQVSWSTLAGLNSPRPWQQSLSWTATSSMLWNVVVRFLSSLWVGSQ